MDLQNKVIYYFSVFTYPVFTLIWNICMFLDVSKIIFELNKDLFFSAYGTFYLSEQFTRRANSEITGAGVIFYVLNFIVIVTHIHKMIGYYSLLLIFGLYLITFLFHDYLSYPKKMLGAFSYGILAGHFQGYPYLNINLVILPVNGTFYSYMSPKEHFIHLLGGNIREMIAGVVGSTTGMFLMLAKGISKNLIDSLQMYIASDMLLSHLLNKTSLFPWFSNINPYIGNSIIIAQLGLLWIVSRSVPFLLDHAFPMALTFPNNKGERLLKNEIRQELFWNNAFERGMWAVSLILIVDITGYADIWVLLASLGSTILAEVSNVFG